MADTELPLNEYTDDAMEELTDNRGDDDPGDDAE